MRLRQNGATMTSKKPSNSPLSPRYVPPPRLVLYQAQEHAAAWAEMWTTYAAVAAQRAADLLVLAYEMDGPDKPPARCWLDRARRHALHSHAAQARAKEATERMREHARALGLRP